MTMHGRLSFWVPNKPEVVIGFTQFMGTLRRRLKESLQGFTHLKHCINLLICVHSDCLSKCKQIAQDERAIHSVNFLVAIEPYKHTTYVYSLHWAYGFHWDSHCEFHGVECNGSVRLLHTHMRVSCYRRFHRNPTETLCSWVSHRSSAINRLVTCAYFYVQVYRPLSRIMRLASTGFLSRIIGRDPSQIYSSSQSAWLN